MIWANVIVRGHFLVRFVIGLITRSNWFTFGVSNMNVKSRFAFNGFSRPDIRIAVCIVLFIYSFFAWRERNGLATKLHYVKNSLKILRQMHDYAENVCTHKGNQPKSDIDRDMELVRLTKRQDVTKQTVEDDVTFILMSPTLRCISGRVSWIRKLFKHAKINVAIDTGITVQNHQSPSDSTARSGYFFGGFKNRAEALNRVMKTVTTKYFMIIDHSVDLISMRSDFVENLLSNMPGFDVLSGSEVDMDGLFNIPCQRLRVSNWSFYETYEYNVSGNILRCDGTSLFFLGRTEAFNSPTHEDLFDVSLPSKWLQDFFFRFRGILEVGVVPELIIYRRIPTNCFNVPPVAKSLSERVDKLLPFANKYQIFHFDNGTDGLSVCTDSGKMICSEMDVGIKWNLKRWTSIGLTAYPFVIESLRKALDFGTKRLKESHLSYVIEGGTLLGFIKIQDILPWDHGDVDTFVYTTRRNVINMVKKTQREHKYNYWLRHTGFHTYVTPEPNSLNGCIVYLTRRVKPQSIVFVKNRGRLFPVDKKLFKFLRDYYGSFYLESHMKKTNERIYCKIPGHHACIPDCRWDGCGGGQSAFPGIL